MFVKRLPFLTIYDVKLSIGFSLAQIFCLIEETGRRVVRSYAEGAPKEQAKKMPKMKGDYNGNDSQR